MPKARWRFEAHVDNVELDGAADLLGFRVSPNHQGVAFECDVWEEVERERPPAVPSPDLKTRIEERFAQGCAVLQLLTGRAGIRPAVGPRAARWSLQNRDAFPGAATPVLVSAELSWATRATIPMRVHPPLSASQLAAAEAGLSVLSEHTHWRQLAAVASKGRQRDSFLECYVALDNVIEDLGRDYKGRCEFVHHLDATAADVVTALDPWLTALSHHYRLEPIEDNIRSDAKPEEATIRIERVRKGKMRLADPGANASEDVLRSALQMLCELRNAYVHWASLSPFDDHELFRAGRMLVCELLTAYWRARLSVGDPPALLATDEHEVVSKLKIYPDDV